MRSAPGSTAIPRAVAPVAVVAVAALSLLAQRTPDFDPTAWLIWGRQLSEGTLSTLGGPSWKPLPVALTTAFAPTGDTVAAWLWLVAARAGAIVALVMAFRVASRLGGRTAGLLAAGLLALATDFLYDAARGDSEGVLVALALWAVDLHLRGHVRHAFAAAVAAALIRPEIGLVLVVHGLWLVWRDERRLTAALLVGACGIAVVAAWLVPEYVGSGNWLRAATRAQNPVPGSPGQSALPFVVTFLNASLALALPAYAGAAYAVVRAVRAPTRAVADRAVLALAAVATVLMVIVAGLAEAGFTGNMRYVTLPAALLCVIAGVGLPPLLGVLRRTPRRRAAHAALVAGGLSVAVSAGLLVRNAVKLAEEERVNGRELPALIARAGGEEAIRRCGPLGASSWERQAVAWRLGLRQVDVRTRIDGSVRTILARRGTGAAERPTPPVGLVLGDWVLRSSCL